MNDYERWLERCEDESLHAELLEMDETERKNAFYKDVEFGTGGLRAIMGAGSNRINVYTVGRISQGLSAYINQSTSYGSVAISYDSRKKSIEFAVKAACVFAANHIRVHLFPTLMPTPVLSYAVRYLHCDAGVMITASHNPEEYNGYKVYDHNGCQVTDKVANEISNLIEGIDVFDGVKTEDFSYALGREHISFIKPDVLKSFLSCIRSATYPGIEKRDLKIIYTPLHGTGLVPVTKALTNAGFKDVFVVPEQEKPDGSFSTCQKPNPELREAMEVGMKHLKEREADVLFATDPDCDRCGVGILKDGEIRLLNGNEIGILMFDFLLKFKPHDEKSIIVKTIVSSDEIDAIAKDNNIEVRNVLTGFKYIGETINRLEEKGEESRYFMGFEESYGYLTGTHVRDKDAVDAATTLAFMFQHYKDEGISPLDRLEELAKAYGRNLTTQDNFYFEGAEGFPRMERIMEAFRLESHDDFQEVHDYEKQVAYTKEGEKPIDLPVSNVMKFFLKDGSTLTIRPSGTEPKIKIYYYIVSETEEGLQEKLQKAKDWIKSKVDSAA